MKMGLYSLDEPHQPISENLSGSLCYEILSGLHQRLTRELLYRTELELLHMSVRANNVCLRNRLETIGDVMALTSAQVLRLTACGTKSREEIKTAVQRVTGERLSAWENLGNLKDKRSAQARDLLSV